MDTLNQEAIDTISKLLDTANIDDIMYHLYLIDKVRKGREASQKGEFISADELEKEIKSW
ncbi:MAG: hypothetical protein HQK89_05445 [Nitrospirae bacterium]|nr:hypothetical protein [Nitrospirota bacterium]